MALESDIQNPDSHLQVVFYARTCKNEFKSAQRAAELGVAIEELPPEEFVNDTVDYIKIVIPGNKDLEIDTPAREEHKKRFPMHWAAYKNRSDETGPMLGTPIEQWPRISKSVAEELRAIRFYTVQAVAGASDAQLQAIGMIAGQSAFTFRDEARRYLATTAAASKLSEAEQKEKEANEKLANAYREMEEMRKQMMEFMQKATQATDETEVKRGRGRPAKAEVE